MRPPAALNPPTLIVGPSWVGDMVMADALFRLLKAREPDTAIDVLAPGWSLPIVARMAEIRHGISAETGHGEISITKRWRIARSLKREGYGRAIVLPRSFKSALIPWFAGIPRRTGFRGEARYGVINDVVPFDREVLDQTVKRFIALGTPGGGPLPAFRFPRLSVDRERQQRLLHELRLDESRRIVAMMPGAEYGPAKCWPLEYFAQLARQLHGAGYSVWVLGSAKDRPSGELIAEQSPAINLCGKTSLADAIDLLGAAEQAVSNDSGLMHVAAAVGAHVQGVYGSSSPHFTPPLTNRFDVHYLGLDCSPCFARECPLGHLNCLRELRPETVLERIRAASGARGDIGDDAART